MASGILKLLGGIVEALGGFFKWKASPNKQYSDAEKAVEKADRKREEKRQSISDAVYGGDESAVNSLIHGSVVILVAAIVACSGCMEPKVKVVRVTEDRYVSSVTNSLGEVLYWKVPPSVMVELLTAKTELEELKKQNRINERLKK